MFRPGHFKKASALILTMVILTAVLVIALGSAFYIVNQTKIIRAINYSAPAYYAAESGIECMLYRILILNEGQGSAKNNCNAVSNLGNTNYNIKLGDGGVITSTGAYATTSRAIQIYIQ